MAIRMPATRDTERSDADAWPSSAKGWCAPDGSPPGALRAPALALKAGRGTWRQDPSCRNQGSDRHRGAGAGCLDHGLGDEDGADAVVDGSDAGWLPEDGVAPCLVLGEQWLLFRYGVADHVALGDAAEGCQGVPP